MLLVSRKRCSDTVTKNLEYQTVFVVVLPMRSEAVVSEALS